VKRRSGNGPPKITVTAVRKGPGWLYFGIGQDLPLMTSATPFVNQAFCDWQKENPTYQVRSALGIVSDGATIGIHVWFDEQPA
jgi:hypothetical protein